MAVVNAPEYGGYDYEFTEITAKKFICSICMNVLRDPHLTLCCGQHYCQSCLNYWFKKHGKKSCPHCQEKMFKHVLNKEKRREIGELKIHCKLHKEGCQWVGELDSLQTHLTSNKGCGYMKVSCTNKCGEKMRRKEQTNHLANHCVLRKCRCLHCNFIVTYQEISRHNSICPNMPLLCPNSCGEGGIRRKNMAAHREICPLEPVECPFAEAGCRSKVVRRDFGAHVADNQQQHTLMLMQAFKASRVELQLTKTRLVTQIKAQQDLASQLCAHEKELRATKKELIKLEAMREVVATDVKILAETNPSNLALESIKTQMRLGLKNVRLKLEGEPLTIRMLRVSHYEQTREAWSSPPFYYDTGYKMCLSVSLESERAMEDQYSVQLGWMGSSVRHATGTGAWTYASVSLLLLKGEFDDQLTWPYPAKGSEISIQLQSDMHPGIHVFYGWHSHQQSQGSHQQRQAIYSVCSRCARLKLQRVSDGEGSQVVGVQRINNNDQTNKHHDSIVLKVSVDRHSCLR